MVTTYGLKMNGLSKAVERINSWPKYESRGYTQIDYNPKTGDIYTKDHIGWELGDHYCTYKDPAVINIGFYAHHMTEQRLADAIYWEIKEIQKASGEEKRKRRDPWNFIHLSNGEKVDNYGIPIHNMEKALKEINNWGKFRGRTQIDYSLASGMILYYTHVSESAYIHRESANVVALGCITGCITGQELADMIRDAVKERKKKEEE